MNKPVRRRNEQNTIRITARVITPRDQEFFEKIKTWRRMKPGILRDKLFGELHKQQVKHLEFYAYKFQSPLIKMDQDDAKQAANIGFLRALMRWDPKRGSWITCLFLWVRREIQDEQAKAPVVYRPHNVAKPYKVYRAQEAYEAKHGHKPEPEELGVTRKLWDLWEQDCFFSRRSIDGPVQTASDERVPFELKHASLDPECMMMAAEEQQELDRLTDQERHILLNLAAGEDAQCIRDAFTE